MQVPQIARLKLVYTPTVDLTVQTTIKCPRDAYDAFIQQWDMDTICLRSDILIMYLNFGNKVLGILPLHCGKIESVEPDVKLILGGALTAGASKILIAENYPSGNLVPGDNEKERVKRIHAASQVVGVPLVDYLILNPKNFESFANLGIIS